MLDTLAHTSYASGELSPSFWGRTDMEKFHTGASVARNVFVNYRGPMSSRAGTAFVGQSRQPVSSGNPPRIIRFQFSIFQNYILEFGDQYMRVIANGGYVTETPLVITGASNTNPLTVTIPGNTYAVGDWIFFNTVSGMTQLNGRTLLVSGVAGAVVTFADLFVHPVDSRAWGVWTSGGTAARIYTLTAPYAAVDLPYLKFTQSADIMSLTLVNQITNTEYPPYDLTRNAANNWTFAQSTFASTINAPTGLGGSPTVAGTTGYAYVVTAINSKDGRESRASNVAFVNNSADISSVLGSIVLAWNAVPGAAFYNIYKAPASYGGTVPVGSIFGIAGQVYGLAWTDTNVTADFNVTPPQASNPFARGQILTGTVITPGSGFTQAGASMGVNTTTGSGFSGIPIIGATGGIAAIYVINPGQNYAPTDTFFFNGGTGASVTPVFGPATGTYPSVVDYFQERRVYASTLNNPDTYYMSQTGAFTNMDTSNPPIDSDSIIGSPWAQEVNGIQWLRPMPGGLIIATGLDAWQLSGNGGAGSAVTPAQQNAQPQESNGFSPTVQPVKINYDIIYLQSFGTRVIDLQYSFFTNVYAGADISFQSNHLFEGFTIQQWAWAKEPNRLLWCVRNDGKLVSLTFLKEQQVMGWTRHDTNGLFVSVAVASEPPVDAPYFVVQRYIRGQNTWVYYIERMDNRQWSGPEDPWCVDCGLSLPQFAEQTTLTASSATGPGNISGGSVVAPGNLYTAPTLQIIDPTGAGSGAAGNVTFTPGGGITGVNITKPGQGYQAAIGVVKDNNGQGALVSLQISNVVTFTSSASIFAFSLPGDVIRMGGGIAVITQVQSVTVALANLIQPIAAVMPNDPFNTPVPAAPGTWTLARPVNQLTNLNHLEGMTVAILADGNVMPNQIVANGTITLPNGLLASSIKIGLPFLPQLQTLHLEKTGQPTIQGKRKRISAITVRTSKSRGIQIGANQPVASANPFQKEIPWSNMEEVPMRNNNIEAAGAPIPLFTGDLRRTVSDDWFYGSSGDQAAPGFVAVQQPYPLPMDVLAVYPEYEVGDTA